MKHFYGGWELIPNLLLGVYKNVVSPTDKSFCGLWVDKTDTTFYAVEATCVDCIDKLRKCKAL